MPEQPRELWYRTKEWHPSSGYVLYLYSLTLLIDIFMYSYILLGEWDRLKTLPCKTGAFANWTTSLDVQFTKLNTFYVHSFTMFLFWNQFNDDLKLVLCVWILARSLIHADYDMSFFVEITVPESSLVRFQLARINRKR